MSDQKVTPLGRKIVAAILGTTLLALALGFLLNLFPMVYMYRQGVADRASAQAELMAASLVAPVDFDDADAARESLETLSLVQSVTGAAVFVDDTLMAAYGVSPSRPQNAQGVSFGLSELTVVSRIPSESVNSVVVISVSLASQWNLLEKQFMLGIIIFLCVIIVSFKIAGLFRHRLGDPLEQLTEVVHEISQSKDYSRRVDYKSNDEIGILVDELNSMLGKIEKRDNQLSRHREILEEKVQSRTIQLQRKQMELLSNNRLLLSEIKKRTQAEMIREEVERINRHDLKSGLSVVIGYPELLLSEGELKPRQEKHIKRIRAAGYRMLDMIRNQLNIFKMEKEIYALSTTSIDLVEIVCALEEEFNLLLDSSDVTLEMYLNEKNVVGDESFLITGEEPLIRTMFRNVIQNAIEASGSGDTVTIQLHDTVGKVAVISNPAVVPAEVRQRFFDKYVTHGKENGTGLGTYISALIARTHGANISMKTDETSGTSMTIAFREKKRSSSAVDKRPRDDTSCEM
ncbi:ATP-binding protein [Pseudodesulfovibrio sediminis]|uniref:histidine kinase n=1 Tax=Pseudodesulfovibrio sediminis TaxID=2810563 RepID=A0ABN6ERY3_9BACT|nr:ATP-binding protein [Pseudodesulfovibrio sediminis]BCS87643.1 hypothetical protein PSDVSF_08850 [Pseudodesulfovibrio sediminis]